MREYHEEEIAHSLLAINHYRYTDYENIESKCAPDTAIHSYRIDDCVAKLTENFNYPEIFDDIMVRKWRRFTEEKSQETPSRSSPFSQRRFSFSSFFGLWR